MQPRTYSKEQIQALDAATTALRYREEYHAGFRAGFVRGWFVGVVFVAALVGLVYAMA